MTDKAPASPGFKQKAKKEFKDFIIIALYLAFFFCALVTYTMLLLKKYDDPSYGYGFAIINALVVAKVILIGEMASLGKRAEGRPLYQSVLYKAVVFSLLVFAFHFLEEFIKRLIHHEPAGTVLHNINPEEMIGRSILVFCTFLPLFAFIEIRRVIGEEKFYSLFLKAPAPENSGLPAAK
jgi:magnesium-transporting ATPase (P-type)